MNEKAKEFILAIGALAEILRLFREELIRNGFSEKDAMHLVTAYMLENIKPNNNKNQEEK